MKRLLLCVCALTAVLMNLPTQAEEQSLQTTYEWDDHGYVLYCPCMGRFGNQAAHFLGALAFAKKLNRTVAVPPWRSYLRNRNVPFTDWFQIEPVQSYHKSLPLEDFITQLAPTKWPPGNRTGYCYQPSVMNKESEDCEMKYGNPFGPFWDEFEVDFDRSEFTRLTYSLHHDQITKMWMERYPPDKHPVLAFKGAPASFPVTPENRHLQQYVRWSERMEERAQEYINHTIGDAPFIGIHLRMGIDWERACEHAIGRESFMESGQCLDSLLPVRAAVTRDLCLPPVDLVSRHVISLIRKKGIRSLYIASDVEAHVHNLKQLLDRKTQIFYMNPDMPEMDLIMLGKADYFVGNCISSFTAFVKRERDVNNKPSDFFGFAQLKEEALRKHKNEL